MTEITVLIVDDAPALRRLATLVQKAPEVVLLDVCDNGGDAIRLIQRHRPHLVYLGVQLGDDSGLDVLHALDHEERPLFVLVSDEERHALQAFEANALDFLLKPYREARFMKTLARARSVLRNRHPRDRRPSPHRHAPPSGPRLSLKVGSRLVFVDADDIDWISAEGVYVRLHVGGTSYLLRESLNNVEARLDAGRFKRIHRSTMVNVDRIREIVPHVHGGAVVHLCDGTQLKLSRTYRDRFFPTLG